MPSGLRAFLNASSHLTFNMSPAQKVGDGLIKPGRRFFIREVAHIFETPFGFLMNPANYEERHYDLPDGGRRRFYAMTWEDELIWGATAGMLRALYDRLYGAAVA